MSGQVQASGILRFGAFDVDLRAGELRKSGARIRLQGQPFQILTMLLEKPGDVVTREELRQKLWADDTFVDFDDGLNTAIKKLRDTLGDSADSPRFIETLPKRGYRFIYPVNGANAAAEVQILRPMLWSRRPWAVGLLALTALLVTAVAANVSGLRDRITGRTVIGPIASVAVLPCKNLTGDPEQEFLADGLTDVLTTHLAQVKSLTVPSVTSSMYFKGERKRLSEIARELRVQAMVEPSVQRSGDRLLVNLQLIHAPTDRHLWAKSYEVDPKNVQALLPAVAREILEAMNVRVTPEERSRLSSSRETTPEANEAYLRGRYHFRKGMDADRAKAHEYFEKAIEEDAEFALAYASLAVLRAHGGFFRAGGGPLEARTQTRQWAQKALELDDTLAEPHAALAWIEMEDWNWIGAEQEFKRAIELNPNLPVARTWYAQFLSYMRRFEEAFTQAEVARRLDPVSPETSVHSAEPYLYAGRVNEAIESYQNALELEPNYYGAHHSLARAYIQKGMYEQAIEELEKAIALGGREAFSLGVLAHAYARAGRRQEALKLVSELLQRSKGERVPMRPLAVAYSGLGDKDKAFTCLETAYERRGGALFELNSQPLYSSLRSDPRFSDLARRIGLPPESLPPITGAHEDRSK